jgi:hypothetical protein
MWCSKSVDISLQSVFKTNYFIHEKPLVLQFECKTKDFCFLTLLVPVSTDETVRDCSGDTAAVCTATQLSTGNSPTTPIPGCECKYSYVLVTMVIYYYGDGVNFTFFRLYHPKYRYHYQVTSRNFIWLKQPSTNNHHCLCNPADCDCSIGRNLPPVSQTSTMLW